MEDLKHGIIMGTTDFVKNFRETFLPSSPQKEPPQCRKNAERRRTFGTDPISGG
jgi:hypothetical protein